MFSVLSTCRTKSVTVERALGTGVWGSQGDGDDGDNEDVQKESELHHVLILILSINGYNNVAII